MTPSEKGGQGHGQTLPELQLQDIGGLPADGLEDADLPLLFGAQPRGLVPGEDEKSEERPRQDDQKMPPRQSKTAS